MAPTSMLVGYETVGLSAPTQVDPESLHSEDTSVGWRVVASEQETNQHTATSEVEWRVMASERDTDGVEWRVASDDVDDGSCSGTEVSTSVEYEDDWEDMEGEEEEEDDEAWGESIETLTVGVSHPVTQVDPVSVRNYAADLQRAVEHTRLAIVSKLGEEEFSELYETLSRLSAEERECMAEEYGSQQTETLESTRDAAWTMCHLFYLEDKLMECSRMLQQEG